MYHRKQLLSFYGVPITKLRCAVILASLPLRRESICEILCSGYQEGEGEKGQKNLNY
jgi:hypothetical protein